MEKHWIAWRTTAYQITHKRKCLFFLFLLSSFRSLVDAIFYLRLGRSWCEKQLAHFPPLFQCFTGLTLDPRSAICQWPLCLPPGRHIVMPLNKWKVFQCPHVSLSRQAFCFMGYVPLRWSVSECTSRSKPLSIYAKNTFSCPFWRLRADFVTSIKTIAKWSLLDKRRAGQDRFSFKERESTWPTWNHISNDRRTYQPHPRVHLHAGHHMTSLRPGHDPRLDLIVGTTFVWPHRKVCGIREGGGLLKGCDKPVIMLRFCK